MAMNVGELVATLDIQDKGFNSKLDSSSGKFAGFAASAVKYAAVIGAGAVAAGVALYKVGATFDEMSDEIRVGTGATGKALDGLVGSAKNIGKSVPANFGDIGTAVADLNTRLGLTGKPLEAMATQFLNLSRITGTDLKASIEAGTRVFGDWGITAAKQPETLDKLFRASQATGISMDKLSSQMVTFGAPMRELGFSFESTAALLGNFEKSGVNAELVMGGMKQGLGRLAKAGKDPQAEMQKLMESIDKAGLTAENKAAVFEMFGARAGIDMAKAMEEGRFAVGDLTALIANGSETINAAAGDTADFSESWQLFKNNALLAVEPVAARVFNSLGKFMEWVNAVGVPAVTVFASTFSDKLGPAFAAAADAAGKAYKFIQDNSKVFTVVGTLIAAVFIPHLIALGVAATVNAAKVVAAWVLTQTVSIATAVIHSAQVVAMVAKWVFLGAQSLLHAAKVAAAWLIAMGPIGLVIAAVVGLVVVIVKNWDTIKSVITAGWNAVKAATAATWEWIKGAVSAAIAFVTGLFLNFTGPGLIIKHWESIKSTFSNGANAVVGVVSGLPGKILGVFGNARGILANAGRAIIEGLIDGITGAFRRVKDTLGTLTSMLPDWKGPATRDATILRDAGRLVMGGFEAGLVDKFGDVKRTLGSITSDIGDVTGMRVGGPDFVHQRLGMPAAPAVNVAAPDLSELVAEMRAVRAELHGLPRGYRLGERQDAH